MAPLIGQCGKIHAVVVHNVTAVANLSVTASGKSGVAFHETFVSKVIDSRLGGGETDIGELVAHNAVDFLGHSHVERTQACLDMVYGNMQFRRCHSAG